MEVTRRDRLGFAQTRSNVMSMFERMERANFLVMQQMRLHLDAAIRLALYNHQATLLDVRRILTDKDYSTIMAADPQVPDELREHFHRFNQYTNYARTVAINSSIPRLKELLTDPQLFYMVTQPTSTITIEKWLDEGKLVVCDVATDMDNNNALLLGNLLLAHFLNATFNRRVAKTSRVWRLVADEFDQLAGDNFANLISKARSYRSIPIMAHQNLSQLSTDNDTTLYNAVTSSPVKFTFRISGADEQQVETWIRQPQQRQELGSKPDHTAFLTLTRGLPGLLDPADSAPLLLDPLQGEDNEAALAAAILSQKAHTVSERALVRRGKIEGDDDTPRPHPLQKGRQPVPPGDDPTGDSDPGTLDDFPLPDLNPGSESLVSGFTQQPGAGKRRPRRPKSS